MRSTGFDSVFKSAGIFSLKQSQISFNKLEIVYLLKAFHLDKDQCEDVWPGHRLYRPDDKISHDLEIFHSDALHRRTDAFLLSLLSFLWKVARS